MSNRVAIVGASPGHENRPKPEDGWDVWCLNRLWGLIPPEECTRWFELHRRSFMESEFGRQLPEHLEALSRVEIPVEIWDVKEWPEWPTAKFFTLSGSSVSLINYHASSFDWLVARAIAEEFEEIHLFGIEGVQNGEPPKSTACLEFWCGLAMGRGIKVVAHEPTSLFKTVRRYVGNWLYGFDPYRQVYYPNDSRGDLI